MAILLESEVNITQERLMCTFSRLCLDFLPFHFAYTP